MNTYTTKHLFIDMLKKNILFLGMSLFFLVLTTISTLLLPYLLRRFVDDSGNTMRANENIDIFIPLLIVSLILALSSGARMFCVELFSHHAVDKLRLRIFSYILKKNPQLIEDRHSGDLISVLTNEIETIKTLISSVLSSGLRSTTIAIGSTSIMIYTNPYLSMMSLLFFPIVIIFAVKVGKKIRKLITYTNVQKASLNEHTTEILQSVKLVNAFSLEDNEIKNQQTLMTNVIKNHTKKTFFSALFIFIAMFSVLTFVVTILWLGTIQTEKGLLTAGELTQFSGYAFINALVLSSLSSSWNDLQNLRGNTTRIINILNSTPIIIPSKKSQIIDTKDFETLSLDIKDFQYPHTSKSILKDIKITITKGQKIAIVGPSGSGKSTLFKLLLRFYEPTKGHISINQENIHKLDINNLREHFAYLPQDNIIFSRSIAQNIGYALSWSSITKKDTLSYNHINTQEKIISAAKIANIHDFIEKLPKKYDTQCGEKASRISGGEKQRIAIARTVLKHAPCLLLDEPTSALDSNNEHLIRDAIDKLIQDRTAIIIAHRLNTVKNADMIYVMNEGKIIEKGKHPQLMQTCPLYQQLITKQFT